MADVYELANEQRALLASLDRVTATRMETAYRRLLTRAQQDYRAFTAALESWQLAHPSMDPRGASPPRHWVYQQQRYQELIGQLNLNLAFYADVSNQSIRTAQEVAMRQVQVNQPAMFAAALGGGEAAGAISLAILPEDAIEAVVGFTSDGTPLHTLLRQRSLTVGSNAAQTVVEGVALGFGVERVASMLDGQLSTLHWQNLRLARTEVLRAYREAQRVNMLQNAEIMEGWVWSSAADGRTCPICLSQHGKVFPLDTVAPSEVPPDVAQHKGLADIYAKAPVGGGASVDSAALRS